MRPRRALCALETRICLHILDGRLPEQMSRIREKNRNSSKFPPTTCNPACFDVAQVGQQELPRLQNAGLHVVATLTSFFGARSPFMSRILGSPGSVAELGRAGAYEGQALLPSRRAPGERFTARQHPVKLNLPRSRQNIHFLLRESFSNFDLGRRSLRIDHLARQSRPSRSAARQNFVYLSSRRRGGIHELLRAVISGSKNRICHLPEFAELGNTSHPIRSAAVDISSASIGASGRYGVCDVGGSTSG